MRFLTRLLGLAAVTILAVCSLVLFAGPAGAHQSGCHRWHSCPSDSGSYVCGDLGYACQYPSYPTAPGPDPTLPDYTAPSFPLGGSEGGGEYLTRPEVRKVAKSGIREKW